MINRHERNAQCVTLAGATDFHAEEIYSARRAMHAQRAQISQQIFSPVFFLHLQFSTSAQRNFVLVLYVGMGSSDLDKTIFFKLCTR